jgi:transposase
MRVTIIDEKAVHKRHDYISILSDEQTGIVIDVIEGRSGESVEELCQTWQPFIKGINTWFPNALHCHDPFHCVGYLNKAVDKCRKREVKQHEELRTTKWLFLKDTANFTDEQRRTVFQIQFNKRQ